VRGCASTTRIARASEFDREAAMARASRGGVYASVNRALALPLIFIEHANGFRHHRPISTLIRPESNTCGP
jgi:hypothetical protein